MTEYRKQQIIVGILGATLNSLLPAFILQSEKHEGRDLAQGEASQMALEVYRYADQLLTEHSTVDG